MPMPPMPLVMEALRETVGPSLALGIVALGFGRIVFGKSSASLAACLALLLSLVVGYYHTKLNPNIWPTEKRITWIPWLTALAGVSGAFVRRWPAVGYSLWAVATTMAVVHVVPKEYHTKPLWVVPAFVLLTSASGFGLLKLCDRRPGGLTPFVAGAALMTAGTVIIHAHSKSLLDVATFGGMCLFGCSLVVVFTKGDVGAVFPGAALLLACTLFAGYHETFSSVPTTAFVLPAVAPLWVLVGLLPVVDRQRGWLRVLIVLLPVCILLAVATGLAMSYESLAFDDDH
jgi:hypothetical protein